MKQFSTLILLGIIHISAAWTTPLSAQTIYVNQDANGAEDGSSWANAFTDLQAAITATPAGGAIWIAKGVYQPGEKTKSFLIDKPLQLYGGFSGSEAALADRNLNDNQTILSGDNEENDLVDDLVSNRTDNSYHVVDLQAGSSGGSLNNLSIIGGNANSEITEGDPLGYGGGIFCSTDKYELNGCIFKTNSAWEGGAVSILAAATEGIRFKDCIFQNNQADYGGGISMTESGAKLQIENGEFSNNQALNPNFGAGGAIYAGSTTTLEITQSIFDNNSSPIRGGAVALYNDVTASFSQVSFTNNLAKDRSGGALYVSGRISLTLARSDFSNNQCGDDGGALYLDLPEPFQLNISESTFQKNSAADDGGAIFLDGRPVPDRMLITDCEFLENTCASSGGAMMARGGPIKIINSQFQKNTAGSGAGISTDFNSVTLNLENCDFVENEANFAGAVELFRGGSSNILNSRFSRNKSVGGSGGAISYDQDKPSTGPQPKHTIEASIFDGNEVSSVNGIGGYGSALFGFNANIDITNSLFINQKTEIASTIFNAAFDDSIDEISLINCTFAQNDNNGTATLGADNLNSSDQASFTLQNNIFADDGDGFINLGGTAAVTTQGGNICSNSSMNNLLTNGKDQPTTEAGFKNTMNDFSLISTSPAINAGVNTGAPEKDLAGNPRDALVDIGAYESQEVSGLFDRPSLSGQISVFPNPVSEQLQLRLENQHYGTINLRIMDATGKVQQQQLLNKNINQLEAIISTTDLPAGMYLLQVFNREGELTTKFVKK